MYIKPEKAANTLLELQNIKEVIRLYYTHDNPDKPCINTLLQVCRKNLGRSIVIEELDIAKSESPILGFVFSWNDGSYTIFHLADLNNCEKRFTVRKELFQLLLDDPAHRNLDLNSHIDDLLTGLNEPHHQGKSSSEVELYAEIMTMELMFPWRDRKKIFVDNNLDYPKIAETYLIPRSMVELYLSNRFIDSFKLLEENELLKKLNLLGTN